MSTIHLNCNRAHTASASCTQAVFRHVEKPHVIFRLWRPVPGASTSSSGSYGIVTTTSPSTQTMPTFTSCTFDILERLPILPILEACGEAFSTTRLTRRYPSLPCMSRPLLYAVPCESAAACRPGGPRARLERDDVLFWCFPADEHWVLGLWLLRVVKTLPRPPFAKKQIDTLPLQSLTISGKAH